LEFCAPPLYPLTINTNRVPVQKEDFMNPTAMDVNSEKDCAPHVLEDAEVLTGEFYERIVRIAGIGSKDTIGYWGGGNAVMDRLLSVIGVRNQIAPICLEKNQLRKKQCHSASRADTILWDANDASWKNRSQILANLGRCLRPGGRLVLWRSFYDPRHRQSCPEAIEMLLASAGFVSIIVGRLPGRGMDAVVATGILVKHRHVDDIRR
jgi:hypothetical protein